MALVRCMRDGGSGRWTVRYRQPRARLYKVERDISVRLSGNGNAIRKADRRGGRSFSTQVRNDLETRRSARSERLSRSARIMIADPVCFEVMGGVVGRIAWTMKDSRCERGCLIRMAAMANRVELLKVRCHLILGFRSLLLGKFTSELGGASWIQISWG